MTAADDIHSAAALLVSRTTAAQQLPERITDQQIATVVATIVKGGKSAAA